MDFSTPKCSYKHHWEESVAIHQDNEDEMQVALAEAQWSKMYHNIDCQWLQEEENQCVRMAQSMTEHLWKEQKIKPHQPKSHLNTLRD